MDGRSHPPAYAPHTWMGFSTGRFVGNALEVRTTHLKQGWLRRNGLPESDQTTLVEFFVRHGDRLTHTAVITDPVYLAEPEIRTTDFFRQPIDHQSWLFPCDDSEQIAGRAPDSVPNYGFGENPFVKEQGDRYHIPAAAYLGGPETAYPEFLSRIPTLTDADGLAKLRPSSSTERQSRAADPTPRDGEIHVWRIRDSVYLLAGDEANTVAQVETKAFVVDPGSGRLAEKIPTEIRRLSDKPIQFIANTSFRPEHTGGNVVARLWRGPERARIFLLAAICRRGRRRHDHGAPERANPDGAPRRRLRAFPATRISKSAGERSTTATRSRCFWSARGDGWRQHRSIPPRRCHRGGRRFTTTQYR